MNIFLHVASIGTSLVLMPGMFAWETVTQLVGVLYETCQPYIQEPDSSHKGLLQVMSSVSGWGH
ncbi:hypothetical protein SAMN05421788_11341 [Filimonas lacunae]|uniref:Uncharacterized protein n=1 Tax=Filimonas lacunae TaxID=477680 RepID=A0A173MBS0_9BACT|nr:hypothetical protein [Filimonas lacunae]BAV05005.1 hypothetical protein FLA_1010 [Filimonas lacunae]SIT33665.1 hypothetical protein SAMN05421788_11341 [Filimonas lacunae]